MLSGTALGVYVRLSSIEAEDYHKVKSALLKRYQLTEEGFRLKFRESKPEVGESPGQYITRLCNYLSRWMKLSKTDETFEGLRKLVLVEQFIQTCPKDLAVYLRERQIGELEEMTDRAERFLEAHGKTLLQKMLVCKRRSKDGKKGAKGRSRFHNTSK